MTEHPIWGLIRIVMAQQVSTLVACRLAERVRSSHPMLERPTRATVPDVSRLRALGLPESRARCCAEVVRRSEEILSTVELGQSWVEALAGF